MHTRISGFGLLAGEENKSAALSMQPLGAVD